MDDPLVVEFRCASLLHGLRVGIEKDVGVGVRLEVRWG